MESSPKTEKEIALMSKIPYKSILGQLLYIAITARPDIATAVSIAGQFAHNPGMNHWKAVLRVLKYLQGTKPMTLTLGGNQDKVQLTAYSDADWAANFDTRRSRSGLVVMINDSPVMWKSKL